MAVFANGLDLNGFAIESIRAIGISTIAAIHWTAVGFLIVGDQSEISQRVRRSLPRTLGEQLVLSWLAPGSARGFMFVVLCHLTFTLMLLAIRRPRKPSRGPGI